MESTLLELSQMVGWDVANDFLVYARNDKDFYPKHYYPCMSKMSDIMDMKKPVKRSHVMPMLKQGMQSYCDKFDLGPADQVFSKEIVDDILKRISTEEMPLIRKGEYRCR